MAIHGRDTLSTGDQLDLQNLRGFLEHGGRVLYGTDLGKGELARGVNPTEIRALQAGLSVDTSWSQ